MKDNLEEKIDNDNYTLYDKFIYGGLSYGIICFPSNIFKLIWTIIFPPLAFIFDFLKSEFPYIDFDKFIMNIDKIIYSFILTSFFYIPGLIYGLSHIKREE